MSEGRVALGQATELGVSGCRSAAVLGSWATVMGRASHRLLTRAVLTRGEGGALGPVHVPGNRSLTVAALIQQSLVPVYSPGCNER